MHCKFAYQTLIHSCMPFFKPKKSLNHNNKHIHVHHAIMFCFQGILLVYDITNAGSFDQLQYWVKSMNMVRA